MLRSLHPLFAFVLVAGGLWHCSGDRVTQSPVAPPLGKLATEHAIVVFVTVQQDGAPVSGATVELSHAIAGRAADYQWSAITNDVGQAQIEIAADNGYYQARAVQDDSEIGHWSSIPLNVGSEVLLALPIGEQAQTLRTETFVMRSIDYIDKAIEHYDREGMESTIHYYNSRASVNGQFYLFLIGADDLYLAHPIFPHLIGTDIKDVVGSDGQELGKEIAEATEEGHWVEYLWPNPVTLREEHKVAWVVRYDGLIFASGYYTSVTEAGPPPWQGVDPREYAATYVQRAIEHYDRDGLEAMKAYYNSVASIEGEFYLFATDADDIYHVHPLIPSLIGTDIKDVVGSDGYELGQDLAKAEEGVGVWVEYLWPHPVTLVEVPKMGYAIRRDGMIFASGYYPAPENPETATKAYIQVAIDKYEQEGLEATLAYYSSQESIEGQWSLLLINEDGHVATFLTATSPGAVGRPIESFRIFSTGFEIGKEIARATEDGHWIHYQRPSAQTGVLLDAHLWVIRYDGLIFASQYFGEPN